MRPERELVMTGLPIVQAVARRLARRLGGIVHVDDLIGVGNIALVEIVRSYDPSRSPFAPYATLRIKWAMLDGLRRETHSRAQAARVMAVIASERYGDGAEPQGDGPTTQEQDQAAFSDLLDGHAAALALGLLAGTSESALAPEPAATPEDHVARAEAAHVAWSVIASLADERQRELMRRHYYEGQRFDLVALELGISKSWASRLHDRSIDALRAVMQPPEGPP